jgi:hypothetical protein
MLGERSAVEKSVEEILIDLMAEKVMSVGIQASSIGGLQASPSTARRSSRTVTEKRSKHRDDLANVKQIPSVLPDYIHLWLVWLVMTVSHMILSTHSSLRTSRRGYTQSTSVGTDPSSQDQVILTLETERTM